MKALQHIDHFTEQEAGGGDGINAKTQFAVCGLASKVEDMLSLSMHYKLV